jgi:hypothetical protein
MFSIQTVSLPYVSLQAETASRMRRHVAASPIQHHQSVESNDCALQVISPSNYSSSLEVRIILPARLTVLCYCSFLSFFLSLSISLQRQQKQKKNAIKDDTCGY